MVAAVAGEPASLSTKVNWSGPGGVFPGADSVEELVHVGLATMENSGKLRERLAVSVPSIENGGWNVFPDGTMETTWQIRPGAAWHDGTALTSADLVFTTEVGRSRELAFVPVAAYEPLESVQAVDESTLRIRWKRPYIYADRLFSNGVTAATELPLPKHILEPAFLQDKAGFLQHPYWTQEFVGTGPFMLREWVSGSHLVLQANDRYLLGRPKLDELEVRFVPDANAVAANLLAGAVELTFGRSLNMEQAVRTRDQWREGRMEATPRNWVTMNPQLLDPNPPVVLDVRLRRAVLHAIDRQSLADSFQSGLSAVAHSYVHPNEPEYPDVERFVARYDYDPRRAMQYMEEVGYARGADGLIRDGAGQPLHLEIRTAGGGTDLTVLAVADHWQQLGVTAESVIIPPQRRQDREYRASFPAFELLQLSNQLTTLSWQKSDQAAIAANNFVGRSKNRYMNPEYDALIDRYYATIPIRERNQALAQIVQHMSEQLITMGMYYNVEPMMIGQRILNLAPGGTGATQAWNAHEWDVR